MTADRNAALVDEIVRDVAELPDRTSPDDWPEAMLVTADELHEIVMAAISAAKVLDTRPSPEGAEAELVERGARAICKVRGLNPDCLFEHHEWEDWPADERQDYSDPFTGEPRIRLMHRGWRNRAKDAEAVIAALAELRALRAGEGEKAAIVAWLRESDEWPETRSDIAMYIETGLYAELQAGAPVAPSGEAEAVFVEWLASLNPELPDDYQIGLKASGVRLINMGHLRALIAALSPAPATPVQEEARAGAIRAFLAKWDQAEPHISSVIQIATIHHCPYGGLQLDEEIEALRALEARAGGTGERAAIVAWLREKVAPCRQTASDIGEDDDEALTAWVTRAGTYEFAADAIERGDHL